MEAEIGLKRQRAKKCQESVATTEARREAWESPREPLTMLWLWTLASEPWKGEFLLSGAAWFVVAGGDQHGEMSIAVYFSASPAHGWLIIFNDD